MNGNGWPWRSTGGGGLPPAAATRCVSFSILFTWAALPLLAADVPFEHKLIDPSNVGADCKAVGDINGDGFPDVVVAAASYDSGARAPLQWYEYPSWTKHVISTQMDWSTDMQVADVDGDGDLDVIVPKFSTKEVFWFENPARPGTPPPRLGCPT